MDEVSPGCNQVPGLGEPMGEATKLDARASKSRIESVDSDCHLIVPTTVISTQFHDFHGD